MVRPERRNVGFNYKKFLRDLGVMSSIFGSLNLAACGYQIYKMYHDNVYGDNTEGKTNMTSIFFILIGAALSSMMLITSIWAIELKPKPDRARNSLNSYCCLICIITTVQLLVYIFDCVLISFKPYTFWVSLSTTWTTFLVTLRFYGCTGVSEPSYNRRGIPFHSTRYINTSDRYLYPNIEDSLGYDRNNREDEIPTYEELILQDRLRKDREKDLTSISSESSEEGGPAPPKYEDIV